MRIRSAASGAAIVAGTVTVFVMVGVAGCAHQWVSSTGCPSWADYTSMTQAAEDATLVADGTVERATSERVDVRLERLVKGAAVAGEVVRIYPASDCDPLDVPSATQVRILLTEEHGRWRPLTPAVGISAARSPESLTTVGPTGVPSASYWTDERLKEALPEEMPIAP